jgi:ribosomal protein S18 acetylase RimI-like enzyme
MILLHSIRPAIVTDYKAIRLRALQDKPTAFGSTYARESRFTDAEWIERAANLCTLRSMGYLAFNQDEYCGIAGCFLNQQNPLKAELVSLWVAPEHRQIGIGRMLLEAIQSWASRQSVHTLQLMVTSNNHSAIEFYRRNGFSMTAHTEPYPNDPNLIEYQMSKSILQP